MVRNYRDEPVDPEVVERIVEAGRRAPSAGHSQGQALVVVTGSTGRKEIARLAGEEEYVAMGMDPWISRAPVHIIVCVSMQRYLDRYAERDKMGRPNDETDWPVPYWWVDAGASMMLLLLAARAEGLEAGFLGSHRMDDLKQAFGIPADMEPIGVVTIGHPAPDRRSTSLDRGRRDRSETIHYERW